MGRVSADRKQLDLAWIPSSQHHWPITSSKSTQFALGPQESSVHSVPLPLHAFLGHSHSREAPQPAHCPAPALALRLGPLVLVPLRKGGPHAAPFIPTSHISASSPPLPLQRAHQHISYPPLPPPSFSGLESRGRTRLSTTLKA